MNVARSKIIPLFGIVMLLLGTVPTPIHSATPLIGAVALLIWLLLLRYGPPTRSGKSLRIALYGVMAVFVGSLVNIASDRGDWISPVFIAGVLTLWVLLGKYPPWSPRAAILRSVTFIAILVFAVSISFGLRSGYSYMRQGCFWTIHLPFRQMILLPRPYDYYVVHQFLPILCSASLEVVVVSSVPFLIRRRHPD